MKRRRCPACGAKVGRDNLMCGSCGFYAPTDQPEGAAPVAAPVTPSVTTQPQRSAEGGALAAIVDRVSSQPARTPGAVLDIPMPGTRQWVKALVTVSIWLVFTVVVADPFISPIIFVVGAVLLAPVFFSVVGWEHIVLTADELRLERRLFGRVWKKVVVQRSELEAVVLGEEQGMIARFFKGDERDQDLWNFTNGPIIVIAKPATYRFGQGLFDAHAVARELVDRVQGELTESASA